MEASRISPLASTEMSGTQLSVSQPSSAVSSSGVAVVTPQMNISRGEGYSQKLNTSERSVVVSSDGGDGGDVNEVESIVSADYDVTKDSEFLSLTREEQVRLVGYELTDAREAYQEMTESLDALKGKVAKMQEDLLSDHKDMISSSDRKKIKETIAALIRDNDDSPEKEKLAKSKNRSTSVGSLLAFGLFKRQTSDPSDIKEELKQEPRHLSSENLASRRPIRRGSLPSLLLKTYRDSSSNSSSEGNTPVDHHPRPLHVRSSSNPDESRVPGDLGEGSDAPGLSLTPDKRLASASVLAQVVPLTPIRERFLSESSQQSQD